MTTRMTKEPKDNGTPQAVDDILSPQAVESGKEHILGTVNDLMANDRGAKNFYGLIGTDDDGILRIDEGTIEIVNGEIVFTPGEDFKGGQIKFSYAIQMGNNGILSSAEVAFDARVLTNIDFDDASSFEAPIPQNYKGLNWDNQYTFDPGTSYGGYSTLRDYEGDVVSYNAFANPSGFSSAGADFDFLTGQFAAAWNNDLQILIKAYDDGAEVGSLEMTMDPAPVAVDFVSKMVLGADSSAFTGRFESIDAITFQTSGGTNAGLLGSGEHFATDDWKLAFVGT